MSSVRHLILGTITSTVLVAALLFPSTTAFAATPSVFAVDPTVTVRPEAEKTVPAAAQHAEAQIVAARNEFESTQIVVEAGDTPLNEVTVSLSGPLYGLGGENIPAANVTIYREATYTVPTDYASDRDGGAGRWPDPLIPEVDPYFGQNRNAFPVDVIANERVTAWVDVLVPQGQTQGQYNGSIVVSTSQGQLATVPLRVKVLDLTMPSMTTMDTAFLLQDNNSLCRAHTGLGNCGNEEKRWALHSLYGRVALENRFTISNIAPLAQDSGPPTGVNLTLFQNYILPMIQGQNPSSPPAEISSAPSLIRLPGAKLTTQSVYGYRNWHCLETCVDAWEAYAQSEGYKDRLWLYACDEPGTSDVNWDNCESIKMDDGSIKVGGLNKSTGLRKMVTAHPQRAKNNGALDKIDLLVTNIREITGKPHCCSDWFEENQRELPIYDEFFQDDAGTPSDKLWIYTACDAAACTEIPNSQDATWDLPLYDDWGSYAIDQKDTQTRVMGWLVYAYEATGELYYEVAAKLRQSWAPNGLWYYGGQGDGTLFYPGIAKAGTGGDASAPIIGGTDDIPIESIRMKEIRDSREDFELLHQLELAGKSAQAQTIAKDLFGSPDDTLSEMQTKAAWTTPSAQDMTDARCAALSELTQTVACSWDVNPPEGGADLKIEMTADRAPVGPSFTYTMRTTNLGPEAALDVSLTQSLPEGLRFDSTDHLGCTAADQKVACTIDYLESGNSSDIAVRVTPRSEGPFTSAVSVDGDGTDSSMANNTATWTVKSGFICDVKGTGLNDKLTGTNQGEVICGLGGNDKLTGNGGDDLLFGGPGSDTARFAGSPHPMVVNLNFQSLEAEGAWPRKAGTTGDGNDHFASIERAIGSSFNDLLVGSTAAGNRLNGGAGGDTIHGYDHKDTLKGGSGDDKLYGRGAFDTLKGGKGTDLCDDATASKSSCER